MKTRQRPPSFHEPPIDEEFHYMIPSMVHLYMWYGIHGTFIHVWYHTTYLLPRSRLWRCNSTGAETLGLDPPDPPPGPSDLSSGWMSTPIPPQTTWMDRWDTHTTLDELALTAVQFLGSCLSAHSSGQPTTVYPTAFTAPSTGPCIAITTEASLLHHNNITVKASI